MITTAWLIVDWWWWLVSKQTVTAVITILTFVPLQQQQQLCDHRHPHYSTVSRSGLQSSPTFTSHGGERLVAEAPPSCIREELLRSALTQSLTTTPNNNNNNNI